MKWDTILFLLNILLAGWMLMGTSDAAGCGNPTRLCCQNGDNTCYVVGPRESGSSSDDRCYCDSECVSNNNCCLDYKSTCTTCTILWTSFPNKASIGGAQTNMNTLASCQAACISSSTCVAIDYDIATSPPCWIHDRLGLLKNLVNSNTANQYRIQRTCSCANPWASYIDTMANGATQTNAFKLADCQAACMSTFSCVAIDYDIKTNPPCWIHNNVTALDLSKQYYSNSVTQYRINRECITNTPGIPSSTITEITTTLRPPTLPPNDGNLKTLITIPATFQGVVLDLNLRINPDIPEKLPYTVSEASGMSTMPSLMSTGVYNDNTNKASLVVKYVQNSTVPKPVMGSIIRGDSLYALFPANSSSDSDVTISGAKFRSVREDIKDIIQLCRITGGSKNLAKLFYPTRRRRRRQIDQPPNRTDYQIELLLMSDFKTFLKYRTWCSSADASICSDQAIEKIRNYLFLVINLVSLRFFSNANDNFSIRLKTVDLIVFGSEESNIKIDSGGALVTDSQGRKTLNGLEALKILSSEIVTNTATKDFVGNYDHAALITDYKFTSDLNVTDVYTGFSNLGGMCKVKPSELESVSLVRNRGLFSLVASLAHQLAHSLMVLHDSDSNACDAAEQYLMAPFINQLTYRNADHINYFSTCSINYLQTYFAKQSKDFCLRKQNWNISKVFTYRNNYTKDDFCVLAFGTGSKFCQGDHQDICNRMECWDQNENRCVSFADVRAIEGIDCGYNMRCRGGKCSNLPNSPTPSPTACYYKDYIDYFYTSIGVRFHCAYSMNQFPNACYDSEVKIRCCETCDKRRKTLKDCEYGNKDVAFCGGMTSPNNQTDNRCYDTAYANKCCDNCAITTQLPNCAYGDRINCNAIVNPDNCSPEINSEIARTCCYSCSFFTVTPVMATNTAINAELIV